MKDKKLLVKILYLLFLICFIKTQPSKNKDNVKLTNQYMKKKNQCYENICAASGINLLIKGIISKLAQDYVYLQNALIRFLKA